MAEEDELKEYQIQLDEVEGLLLASPDDPSLLSLKSDLLELIATVVTVVGSSSTSSSGQEGHAPVAVPPAAPEIGAVSDWSAVAAAEAASGDASDAEPQTQHQQDATLQDDNTNFHIETAADRLDPNPESAVTTETTAPAVAAAAAVPSKKSKPKRKIGQGDDGGDGMDESVFQVPRHLVINTETDSPAEQNRKRRAIKALKNTWRGQKKEAEARNKQKSWQSFQKKQKKSSSTSATGAGGGTSMFSTNDNKVGIVTGRNMTEFKGPQRHK